MVKHRRNSSLAGCVMLVGVLIMAVSSEQAWGHFEIAHILKFLPLGASHDFAFDQAIFSDGTISDVRPAILIVCVVVGLCALALFVTRVRGLGLLWRVISLGAMVIVGVIVVDLWSVVNDPGGVMQNSDSRGAQTLGTIFKIGQTFNALKAGPGPGLWMLTVGAGLAVVGALIPAFRSKETVPEPPHYQPS